MICKGGTRETFGYIPKEVVAVLRDVFAERDLNGTEASLFSPCLSTAPSRVSCAGDFQTMAEAVELPILGYPVTNHGGRLVGRVVVEVKTRTVHDNMKDSSSNRCCHVVGYSHGAATDTCCSQALVITPRRYSLLNSSDGTMTNAEEENDVYDPQYVHIEWGLTAGDDTENTCTKSQSLLMPFVGTWLQPSRRIFYSPPLPPELSSVDAVRSAHTNRSIEILTKGASGKVSTPDDDNRLPPIFIHGWRSAYLSTAKLDVENQKQNDTKIEIRQLVNPGNEVSQSAVATVQAMWKEHLRASISLSLQDELNKEAQKRKLNATLANRRLRSLVCALRSQLRQTLGLCHQSTSTPTGESQRRWLSSAEMHGIRYVNERKTDEGATFTGCAQAKVYEFDEQMRQAAIKLARPLGQGLFERHGCRNQNVHMTVVAAIPLGTDCTAAQCIRSITNNVDNQSWRTHGLPFDWIRTTPYGIGRVLTALITTVCQKHSGEWDKIHKTSRVLESTGTKMTDSRSQLRLPFRQSHRTGGGKEGLQDGSSMTDECVRVVAHERNTNNYFTTNTESTAELFLYDQEYGFVGSQQELAGNTTTLGSERFERRLQRLKEVLQNQSYQQKNEPSGHESDNPCHTAFDIFVAVTVGQAHGKNAEKPCNGSNANQDRYILSVDNVPVPHAVRVATYNNLSDVQCDTENTQNITMLYQLCLNLGNLICIITLQQHGVISSPQKPPKKGFIHKKGVIVFAFNYDTRDFIETFCCHRGGVREGGAAPGETIDRRREMLEEEGMMNNEPVHVEVEIVLIHRFVGFPNCERPWYDASRLCAAALPSPFITVAPALWGKLA